MSATAVAFEQTQSHPLDDVHELPDQSLRQVFHAHDGVAKETEVKRAAAARMVVFMLTECSMKWSLRIGW